MKWIAIAAALIATVSGGEIIGRIGERKNQSDSVQDGEKRPAPPPPPPQYLATNVTQLVGTLEMANNNTTAYLVTPPLADLTKTLEPEERMRGGGRDYYDDYSYDDSYEERRRRRRRRRQESRRRSSRHGRRRSYNRRRHSDESRRHSDRRRGRRRDDDYYDDDDYYYNARRRGDRYRRSRRHRSWSEEEEELEEDDRHMDGGGHHHHPPRQEEWYEGSEYDLRVPSDEIDRRNEALVKQARKIAKAESKKERVDQKLAARLDELQRKEVDKQAREKIRAHKRMEKAMHKAQRHAERQTKGALREYGKMMKDDYYRMSKGLEPKHVVDPRTVQVMPHGGLIEEHVMSNGGRGRGGRGPRHQPRSFHDDAYY